MSKEYDIRAKHIADEAGAALDTFLEKFRELDKMAGFNCISAMVEK